MKKLIIWGNGSHAGNVLATLERIGQPLFESVALISDQSESAHVGPWTLPFLGNRKVLSRLNPQEYMVFPAVGMPPERKAMSEYIQKFGFEIPSLIDPSAIVESGVKIGAGCLIRSQCVLGYGTELEAGVLLNSGAQVSHQSQIGAYSSLFPGSLVLGNCTLETGVLLGAKAVIKPQCRIGCWSKIGIGSVVMADLPAYITAQGNPASIVRQYQGPQPVTLLAIN
jgi:acetyltransferase EpsM